MSAEASPFSLQLDGFDINAAFQNAASGIVSDEALGLDEKVRRMELIVSEGSSELYRDFVDMRQLATQFALACSHDHQLTEAMQASETLSNFHDEHHSHDHSKAEKPTDKKAKKKKKALGWLALLATAK